MSAANTYSEAPVPAPAPAINLSKKHTGGRPPKYTSNAERKVAQKHNAIVHYHRKKALQNKLVELASNNVQLQNGDEIEVEVNISCRALGDYTERLTYRVIDLEKSQYQLIATPAHPA